MTDYRLHKPQPNAIATEQGWVNPDNNELLSSIRGLKSYLESLEPTIEVVEPIVEIEPKKSKRESVRGKTTDFIPADESSFVKVEEPILEVVEEHPFSQPEKEEVTVDSQVVNYTVTDKQEVILQDNDLD